MDHDNPSRAYGLAFVPKRKVPRRKAPELILKVETRDLSHLERYLGRLGHALERASHIYLFESLPFLWPGVGQLELPLGRPTDAIGYRGAGYLKLSEEAEMHLPLRRQHVKETALTLAILLGALQSIPREERLSNRPQLLEVTTNCKTTGQYAHPVYGYVFPTMRRWLHGLGEKGFPPEVVEAMRETWRAVAPEETRKYADECYAGVSEDGRFGLVCFGNACDVSIYPDYLWRSEEDAMCKFGCHNLDAPFQQLTLVAGLAAMMEAVEKA